MRINEVIDGDNMQLLADACERWIELSHSPKDIALILSHPFSQQFKTSPTNTVYRSVFYSYKKFQQTGTATAKGQREGFIAYSWNPKWGGAQARDDFDYSGDILRFKKTLSAEDVLLNFTSLANALQKRG